MLNWHSRNKIELEHKQELSVIAISSRYAAFKLEHTLVIPESTPEGLKAYLELDKKKAVVSGIAMQKDVEKFISQDLAELTPLPTEYLSEEEGRILREDGFWPWLENRAHTPCLFALAEQGRLEENNLVVANLSDHTVLDLDGMLAPMGIPFDYLKGNTSNIHYDLAKAEKILREHPRVHKLDFAAIPYFNVYNGKTHYLSFVFEPTADEAKRIWAWCLKGQYPGTMLHQAIFELDLLRLREGGATTASSYYDAPYEVENAPN